MTCERVKLYSIGVQGASVNEKETGYRKHGASHHRLKACMGKEGGWCQHATSRRGYAACVPRRVSATPPLVPSPLLSSLLFLLRVYSLWFQSKAALTDWRVLSTLNPNLCVNEEYK